MPLGFLWVVSQVLFRFLGDFLGFCGCVAWVLLWIVLDVILGSKV
jgi:hypothetical protein